MADSTAASFTIDNGVTFKPKSRKVATENIADPEGRYVARAGDSDTFNVMPASFLSAEPDDDKEQDEGLFVTCSEEIDISGRVDSKVPIFTAELGLAWSKRGAKSSLFVFKDSIAVYRANIGQASRKQNRVTGKATIYMGTYASIGIPIARYKWLTDSLRAVHGIDISGFENSGVKVHANYAWLQVNIVAGDVPKAAGISTDGSKIKANPLASVLGVTKRNLIGNISLGLTLKRRRNDTSKRNIGASLKYMQYVDITSINEPPLNTPTAFAVDPTLAISDNLRNLLLASTSTAAVTGASASGGPVGVPGASQSQPSAAGVETSSAQ